MSKSPSTDVPTNHTYNLRPRPMQRNEKYNMIKSGQQSAVKSIIKPHINIPMMHVSLQQGIKRFRNKGNDPPLKRTNPN